MARLLGIICLFSAVLFYSLADAQTETTPAKNVTPENAVVAKIGEEQLTVSDFNRIIGYLDEQRQKLLEQNPALKENALLQIVQSKAVAKVAKAKGLDTEPAVKEQLRFFIENFIANEYLKREAVQKVSVSEEDAKAYYAANPQEFTAPEMVRARHILVKVEPAAKEEEKKKAKDKAESILKRIKAGEDFAKVAAETSDDPGSREKGGDLGFFPKGTMVKPFEETAFSLKTGEVSGVIESPFGYHIVKAEGKKESSLEPFDKVKERVNQKLTQERTKEKIMNLVEEAMKSEKVEMHPELLTDGGK